jgi:hypothetical protein
MTVWKGIRGLPSDVLIVPDSIIGSLRCTYNTTTTCTRSSHKQSFYHIMSTHFISIHDLLLLLQGDGPENNRPAKPSRRHDSVLSVDELCEVGLGDDCGPVADHAVPSEMTSEPTTVK